MSISRSKLVLSGTLLLLTLALPVQRTFSQTSEGQTSEVPTSEAPTPVAPTLQRHGSVHYKRQTLDDKIAVLSKNLELTEPQQVSVKKILERRQQETLRIRDADVPGNVRIDQFRLLQERTITQIRAVLTDEQKKKYDPLISRTRPTASTPQRSVEDWIKATTPH
jgi:hypothetical protein